MTKKHFIALANYIRDHPGAFSQAQILHLANYCQSQNQNFMRSRWLRYIQGECGPNGGRIRQQTRRPAFTGNDLIRINSMGGDYEEEAFA